MANYLQIVNFKSEDEEPFEFECSDEESTIFDVKQFINEEESLGLTDLTGIKIYWLFVALQDDVLVKDLLDKKAELYVSLPQFTSIEATGKTLFLVFARVKYTVIVISIFKVKLLSSPKPKIFLD